MKPNSSKSKPKSTRRGKKSKSLTRQQIDSCLKSRQLEAKSLPSIEFLSPASTPRLQVSDEVLIRELASLLTKLSWDMMRVLRLVTLLLPNSNVSTPTTQPQSKSNVNSSIVV